MAEHVSVSQISHYVGQEVTIKGWVYNRTGGSLLLSLMFHAADGLIQIERLGFVGADAERMVWLYSGLWCAMAIGVVLLYGSNLGRQPASRVKAIPSPVTTS